jgi:hypothetical protein
MFHPAGDSVTHRTVKGWPLWAMTSRTMESTSLAFIGASRLRDPDVFASRALRPLPSLKGHGLSFAKLVEGRVTTCRAVKEVLASIDRHNEPKAFITH